MTRGSRYARAVALSFFVLLLPDRGSAAEYGTWRPVEADTCASAWLIQRFVDPRATFRFEDPGVMFPAEVVPYDVPFGELRRSHRVTAFEAIQGKFGVTDPTVAAVGEVIHDIEINIWQRKRRPETPEFAAAIRAIVADAKSDADALAACVQIVEGLYRELSNQAPKNGTKREAIGSAATDGSKPVGEPP